MASSDKQNADRNVYKEMDVEGNLIIGKWKFMDSKKTLIYNLDKCVGCSLCYVVCPDNAIELGPIPEIAQGLIEDTPSVLIDTEKCSFCLMCETICINNVYDAVDENGDEIDKTTFPKLNKMWDYDSKSCKFDESNEICILCESVRKKENTEKGRHFARDLKKIVDNCPTKSIKFKSPLKGKVTILKNQLDKCDPNGCKACVNICPTESFYIPQKAEEIVELGKIACNEDTCIYCGACENSCPENLIIVSRDEVDYEIPEESRHKPWINRWVKQFDNLKLSKDEIQKQNKFAQNSKIYVLEDQEEEFEDDYENISPSQDFSKEEYNNLRMQNASKLEKVEKLFKKSNFRYMIKRKKKDKLKKLLKKELEKESNSEK